MVTRTRTRSGRLRPWGVVGLVAAALVVALVQPAGADEQDELRDKAKRLQQAIEQQNGDVGATTRRLNRALVDLASARAQLPAARAAVAEAKAQLVAAKLQDEAAAAALDVAIAEQTKAAEAVGVVQADIDESYTLIGLIARQAYTQGGSFAELSVALQAETPSDFAGRISAINSIGRAQEALLDRLSVAEADLRIVQREFDLAAIETERLRLEAAAQLERTQQLTDKARKAREQVAALVAQTRAAVAVAEDAKQAELRNLRQLKAEQDRVRRALAAASTGSGIPSGELVWPAPGAVSQGVGPRVHPVYGYASCHTGVDIGAGYGATIVAAAGGRVISTPSGGAYGTATLIDHGNGLSTFYAHQSARLVSVGDRVRKGQAIGRVGATGFVTGPHLHFQVHINGRPYDPMGWFGGAKKPVSCA